MIAQVFHLPGRQPHPDDLVHGAGPYLLAALHDLDTRLLPTGRVDSARQTLADALRNHSYPPPLRAAVRQVLRGLEDGNLEAAAESTRAATGMLRRWATRMPQLPSAASHHYHIDGERP